MALAAEFSQDVIVLDFSFPLWRIFYALSLKEAAPSAQLILFTFADIVDTVGRRDLSCADMTTESARRI